MHICQTVHSLLLMCHNNTVDHRSHKSHHTFTPHDGTRALQLEPLSLREMREEKKGNDSILHIGQQQNKSPFKTANNAFVWQSFPPIQINQWYTLSGTNGFALTVFSLTEVTEVSCVHVEHVCYSQCSKRLFQIDLVISSKPTDINTQGHGVGITFSQSAFKSRSHAWVLLGDEQADFSHAHQRGPALHCGCADVWDDAGQRGFLFRGQNDQHADGFLVIRQLNHLIFQALRCAGHAWQSVGGSGLIVSKFAGMVRMKPESSFHQLTWR